MTECAEMNRILKYAPGLGYANATQRSEYARTCL